MPPATKTSELSKGQRCYFTLFVLIYIMIHSTNGFGVEAIHQKPCPPVVYTIAGSDSGGGAGIQADLHAIAGFGCHGCSAITCLTAQNSLSVTAVHTPPVSFLLEQLDTLLSDMPPAAIKIGMLATRELAETVGAFLKRLREDKTTQHVFVVLDPVMISTSGSRLLDEDAQQALIDMVFPHVDLITPNKFEAEALWNGRTMDSQEDVKSAANYLLGLLGDRGAVMIKGGHVDEDFLASDYVLSNVPSSMQKPRLCDCTGDGIWLQTPRLDTIHTHGTGCTLSSSVAAAMALRSKSGGAYQCIDIVDACCMAKAYVTAGISSSVQIGRGPGPVAHTAFDCDSRFYPIISKRASGQPPQPHFLPLHTEHSRPLENSKRPTLGRLLPIVDSKEWVARLCSVADESAIRDIQLRLKGITDMSKINQIVRECQALCQAADVRLWINDYWEAAIDANCFGVHLGQEDLCAAGNLARLQASGLALGVSTHSFGELAAALGVRPSYISLGPVFATGSKTVQFPPQGLDIVTTWRRLVPPDVPFVVIGGIQNAETAQLVKEAGADCAAVIGAITGQEEEADVVKAAQQLTAAMH